MSRCSSIGATTLGGLAGGELGHQALHDGQAVTVARFPDACRVADHASLGVEDQGNRRPGMGTGEHLRMVAPGNLLHVGDALFHLSLSATVRRDCRWPARPLQPHANRWDTTTL